MAMEVNGYHSYAAETTGSADSASYTGTTSSADSASYTGTTSSVGQSSASGEVKQYKNVDEYVRALKQKFSYFNTTTYIQGVPMTVTVSPAFLKKCLDDPAKADFLERNLSVLPDCVKRSIEFTRTMQGNPVMTYAAFVFDKDGNISMMSGCTNDPDGKIARENAEKRAKEQQEKEKTLEKKKEKKRAERKAEKERLARLEEEQAARQKALRREAAVKSKMSAAAAGGKNVSGFSAANEFTVYGNDVRSMAGKMVQAMNGFRHSAAVSSGAVGFDKKA